MAAGSRSIFRIPWRYGVFLLGCVSVAPFASWLGLAAGIMAGFDFAVLLFLAVIASLFSHEVTAIRRHARENDANRTTILVLTGVVMLVMLVVIASELKQKSLPSPGMLGLILVTLALSWLFSNLIYALHYAYLYYGRRTGGGDHGGLAFPETPEPDYWDFAYFALTLGMTFQTSDVAMSSTRIRRVALFQCLAAFVFNLGVIAFTINILGG